MSGNGFVRIDTRNFKEVRTLKSEIIRECNDIKIEYNRIVNTLLGIGSEPKWRGQGADAFREDATRVKHSIDGIADILKTLTDTLTDCEEVIERTDKSIGDFNRKPFSG